MKYKHNDYYGYINKIQEQAIKNPEWFWSDASEARQWLYNNGASKIVDEIYENTPDNIKKNIDSKKLSTSIKTDQIKQNIYDGQKKFLDTAGSVALQTAPLVAAAPAIIASPMALALGIAGGMAGGNITNKLTNKFSNGQYNTFGEFIRKGEDKGEFKNTFAEFLNPGAIIGGLMGGAAGRMVDTHWVPKFNFNSNSGYRIVDKKGFNSMKNSKSVTSGPTSDYPHFTKGKTFVKPHNNDYLIETKPEISAYHLGRYDTHLNPEQLFTSKGINVGESVTPVATSRNVPITLDTGMVNIYKKLPIGYWKKNITGNNIVGKANYGNIKFIRNTGNLPKVKDGKVLLSPDNNIMTNMTYDQSFITHPNYRYRPGEDYMIIDPEAFAGREFKSIEPMDTFIDNSPIDAKYITILSGNKAKLNQAKDLGFKIIEDQRLIDKFNEIQSGNKEVRGGGIKLNKDGFGYQNEVGPYDKLANQIIKEKIGEVSFPAVRALENSTGLKAGVSPDKFGGIRDWNKFIEKVNETPIDQLKEVEFVYPNGRKIDPFKINKEVSPEKIMSNKLFYDPTTHAESDFFGGISHPTKEDININPAIKWKIEKFESKPLLDRIQ